MEAALTQTYPEQGARLVESIDFGVPVSEIIFQHQERLDGSGYPRRLKADQILLEARIIAVSDALEAMCALRPHRADMNVSNALEELKRDGKSKFDERVVAACVHLFEQRGFRFPE
jgi:HD-GYP domain-containing protein (c-di-GMP phosphodiesterase class II)